MKKVYITTVLTCLVVLALLICGFKLFHPEAGRNHLTVGFIYDNDESTPYTYNFSLAKDAVEKKYGNKVTILTCSNVLDEEMEEPIRELVGEGCDIIFFNGYSELVRKQAEKYPHIQFCQTSYMDMSDQIVPANYHTFKGEAYQARYVSGVAAGMKMKEMILDGTIAPEEAVAGFVAAFPTSEVISGYTAFFLGIRAIVPQALMRVSYTNTWSSYAQEKDAAKQMIEDGCVIISQHTDTIGPAIACEEASEAGKPVYFVGYNQSMSEVAPGTSLVTARIDWEPYVLSAVDAVMMNKDIEKNLTGQVHLHGTDASAGFGAGWVAMDDLNLQVAAEGTQQAMDKAIDRFKLGFVDFVFRGNYLGINPDDPNDTYNLQGGYIENATTSFPLFHYVLKDVITIVE